MDIRRVTITTLADELGVSVCTVNKALYGKSRISEETRNRVLEAASRLGYRPNKLARTMVRRVLNINIVYPSAWPSHMEGLANGAMSRAAELQDYRVDCKMDKVPGFKNAASYIKTVKAAIDAGADGLILILGLFNKEERSRLWALLASHKTPFILLGIKADEDTSSLSSVWHDCRLCGRMAANLLRNMIGNEGHSAIMIGFKDHPDHRRKLEGFYAEAEAVGMDVAAISEAMDDPAQAFPAAKKLFEEHPEITGIYISSENAEGICRYIEENGLTGKVKIVATGVSQYVHQMLDQGKIAASINQCLEEQGRQAVESLFQYLETQTRPSSEILIRPTVLLRSNMEYCKQEKH